MHVPDPSIVSFISQSHIFGLFYAGTDIYRFDFAGSFTDINTTDTSATIKMVRTGTSVQFFADTTLLGTETMSGTVTRINYGAQHPDTGTNTFSIDHNNFKVLDSDGGNDLIITRVLFKNNDVTKFVFNDSGSPVTDIDIITSTTLTTAFNCTYQDIDIQSPTGTQFTFDPSL